MSSVDKLLEFEGATTWMYLDAARVPVVTVGLGMALETVEEALTLPWDQAESQVRSDYAKVQSAPHGYRAEWYKHFTLSRLTEQFIRELAEATLQKYRDIFTKQFPKYPQYPTAVREALDDLMYNLGPGFLSLKNQSGQLKWPRLRGAVEAEDWGAAAQHCHRAAPISEARNTYVADLFRRAAVLE